MIAAHAAVTAGTTSRGASRGLESKPPVWACQSPSELTPGYDILLRAAAAVRRSVKERSGAGPGNASEYSLMWMTTAAARGRIPLMTMSVSALSVHPL